MEKNQTNCPKGVCEKIFRTITFGPAFSTIRRISSRQQTANSSPPAQHVRNPTPPNSNPPPTIKTKLIIPKPTAASKEGSEVPIKFDYIVQSGKPNVSACKSKANNAAAAKSKEELGKRGSKQHYGDIFSAYIHRTRKRIVTHDDQDNNGDNKGQNVVGHGHGGIGNDHHFSDYIDKTKRKIRTTSSIKDWSESFFKY